MKHWNNITKERVSTGIAFKIVGWFQFCCDMKKYGDDLRVIDGNQISYAQGLKQKDPVDLFPDFFEMSIAFKQRLHN